MALTPAEKQRRYRERLKGCRPVHAPKSRDRRSRPQRWRDAVAELVALQDHWRDCLDRLPDALCDTAYGERLRIVAEADIEALGEIEPPRGWGRDT